MPLIIRHLAAAVLPLSATAAGILAVGIAVQLPRGPSAVAALPAVVSPLEPVPGVVAHLPPGTRRAPLPVIISPSVFQATPVAAAAGSPSSVSTAPTRAGRSGTPASASQFPSLPRTGREPSPAEEAAPLTPPVVPAPTTATPVVVQPEESAGSGTTAGRLTTVARVPTAPVTALKSAKHAGKRAEHAAKKAADKGEPRGQAQKDKAHPDGQGTQQGEQPQTDKSQTDKSQKDKGEKDKSQKNKPQKDKGQKNAAKTGSNAANAGNDPAELPGDGTDAGTTDDGSGGTPPEDQGHGDQGHGDHGDHGQGNGKDKEKHGS